MVTTVQLTPGAIYAATETNTALESLQWVRAQGWTNGERDSLADILEAAYETGYEHGAEYAETVHGEQECQQVDDLKKKVQTFLDWLTDEISEGSTDNFPTLSARLTSMLLNLREDVD